MRRPGGRARHPRRGCSRPTSRSVRSTSCRGRSSPGSARRSATTGDSRPFVHTAAGSERTGRGELRRRLRADAGRDRRRRRGRVRRAAPFPPRSVARAARPNDCGRARRARLDQGQVGADRPADRCLPRLRAGLQRFRSDGRRVCRPRARRCDTPIKAPGRLPWPGNRGAGFGTPIVPGSKARILADGVAAAPANAPAAVQAMIAAGNRINHFSYSYGGAHGDPARTMNQYLPEPRRSSRRRGERRPRATTALRLPHMCSGAAAWAALAWRRRPSIGRARKRR